MKHLLAAGLALLFATGAARAATFDAAYMVAAPGSTVEVNEFRLDGPAPWLYVDLPGLGSLFMVVEADWFRVGVATTQLVAVPSLQVGDRFWLGPSETTWNAVKAVGAWSISATYELVGILFAENGGIGVGIIEGSGSAQVPFSVVPAPVPLPAGALLFAPALLALGLRRRSGPGAERQR